MPPVITPATSSSSSLKSPHTFSANALTHNVVSQPQNTDTVMRDAGVERSGDDMRASAQSPRLCPTQMLMQAWIDRACDQAEKIARAQLCDQMRAVGVVAAAPATTPALVVQGDLILNNVPNLRELPDGLRVKGVLSIQYCEHLERLPAGLSIEKTLELVACNQLVSLPPGLRLGGGLSILCCDALRDLPLGLQVQGAFRMEYCSGVRELPEGMFIKDNLHIFNCGDLVRIKPNTVIGTNLYLNACPRLAGLPENVRVGGDVIWINCPVLNNLPSSLYVGGTLSLGRLSLGRLSLGRLNNLAQNVDSVTVFLRAYLQSGGGEGKLMIKVLGMHEHSALTVAATHLLESFKAEKQALLNAVRPTDVSASRFSFAGYFAQPQPVGLTGMRLSEKAVEADEILGSSPAYRFYTVQKPAMRLMSQMLWGREAAIGSYFALAKRNNSARLPTLPPSIELVIRSMAVAPEPLASNVPDPLRAPDVNWP